MVKAVIFDMDGVLADSEALHGKAEDMLLAEFGVKITAKERERFVGVTATEFWLYLKDTYHLKSSIDDLIMKKREYFFAAAENIKPFKGVVGILKRLKSAGIKIAVASSSSANVIDFVLSKLGIANYFDDIVSGEGMKNGKPHPDIFLKAGMKLKCRPSECVVVEDSINGVLAAKAAGMKCIAVTNTFPKQKLSMADLVIASLDAVDADIIKRL